MRDRTQTQRGTGVRTLWCEFCGDGFPTAYKRNAHIKHEHPDLIPFDPEREPATDDE